MANNATSDCSGGQGLVPSPSLVGAAFAVIPQPYVLSLFSVVFASVLNLVLQLLKFRFSKKASNSENIDIITKEEEAELRKIKDFTYHSQRPGATQIAQSAQSVNAGDVPVTPEPPITAYFSSPEEMAQRQKLLEAKEFISISKTGPNAYEMNLKGVRVPFKQDDAWMKKAKRLAQNVCTLNGTLLVIKLILQSIGLVIIYVQVGKFHSSQSLSNWQTFQLLVLKVSNSGFLSFTMDLCSTGYLDLAGIGGITNPLLTQVSEKVLTALLLVPISFLFLICAAMVMYTLPVFLALAVILYLFVGVLYLIYFAMAKCGCNFITTKLNKMGKWLSTRDPFGRKLLMHFLESSSLPGIVLWALVSKMVVYFLGMIFLQSLVNYGVLLYGGFPVVKIPLLEFESRSLTCTRLALARVSTNLDFAFDKTYSILQVLV
eukprot:TRINITY_DN7863_c0_g1_i2.p1 TRINITY_DN7863_c0_g1~~TRINITY_DN7863_c0_g1_i2.p1  ORF type:complete len:431 (-),score=102.67 TRINITY_DN7863_c0_g1_i2:64-1356(-)